MNQSELKKFAQNTRRKLIRQIENRLDYVLNHDDPYLRAHEKEKAKIKGLLDKKGKEQLVEETAYIWFNRLTALRFMDNRGYNRILIVSPLDGESQPNILSRIKQGKFPEEIIGVRQSVYDYIDGKIDSNDPDREAYKITLLAWCNYLGTAMPYLFEKIDDWAALLLPLDLLSEESIVTDIQRGIQKEDCKDVEVIGWLYQYYISEKKDEVFAGLKKNKKITKENIPAATQLFTPEWIVRYMVENSLGRLWLNNFPGSSLKGSMEYFVEGGEEVDSREYGVDSGKGVESREYGVGSEDGNEELPGIDCVAERDGAGQRDLFDNQGVSEGGDLFSDESDTQSGSVSSVEHSRGRGAEIKGRFPSISEYSQGISGRSGDTDRSSFNAEIYKERADSRYSKTLHRDKQDDNSSSEKPEEVDGGKEVDSREYGVDSREYGVESGKGVESSEYLVDSRDRKAAVSQSSLNTNYSLPNTLHISEPTEIKLIDPSCGSGHILVYAFDILYKIYEEEGYTIADIPSLILKNNLFGVDIDDRAAALSAFALAMKARDKDRFFFDKGVVPNVIASREVDVNSGDVKGVTFSEELKNSFEYLKDAKNLGSLIPVSGEISNEISALQEKVEGISSGDFFEKDKIEQLKTGLKQLEYLSPRYHCVITNPPYMGGKGMNPKLKDFVGKHYKDSKSDLFAVFMERGFKLITDKGYNSMVTMQSWMFLSSFEKLRKKLLEDNTIITLVHMGNMVMGIAFGTSATIWEKNFRPNYKGAFCYVEYKDIGEGNKPVAFPPDNERNRGANRNITR